MLSFADTSLVQELTLPSEMQIQGLWKVKHENMSILHAEAKKLMEQFASFKISHVLRVGMLPFTSLLA